MRFTADLSLACTVDGLSSTRSNIDTARHNGIKHRICSISHAEGRQIRARQTSLSVLKGVVSSWRQVRTSHLCALATLSAALWHATTTTASFQSGCYARSRRRPLRLPRWPCRASSEAWLCNPLRTSSPARQYLSQLAQVAPPPFRTVAAT